MTEKDVWTSAVLNMLAQGIHPTEAVALATSILAKRRQLFDRPPAPEPDIRSSETEQA